MRYEEFKAAWNEALQGSRLPMIGGIGGGEESLDLRSMDRRYEVYLEPFGPQRVQPFHATSKLSWRWDVLLTARTRTTEGEVLTEMLGREEAQGVQTARPWLRVDLALRASAPYGQPLPMPTKAARARWVREAMGRLERNAPLIPEESVRQTNDGRLEILAWRGEPEIHAVCGADGELKLESVELPAWQAIELPRQRDGSEGEPEEHPERQVREMFGRVKAALDAWMEVTAHLL